MEGGRAQKRGSNICEDLALSQATGGVTISVLPVRKLRLRDMWSKRQGRRARAPRNLVSQGLPVLNCSPSPRPLSPERETQGFCLKPPAAAQPAPPLHLEPGL